MATHNGLGIRSKHVEYERNKNARLFMKKGFECLTIRSRTLEGNGPSYELQELREKTYSFGYLEIRMKKLE